MAKRRLLTRRFPQGVEGVWISKTLNARWCSWQHWSISTKVMAMAIFRLGQALRSVNDTLMIWPRLAMLISPRSRLTCSQQPSTQKLSELMMASPLMVLVMVVPSVDVVWGQEQSW